MLSLEAFRMFQIILLNTPRLSFFGGHPIFMVQKQPPPKRTQHDVVCWMLSCSSIKVFHLGATEVFRRCLPPKKHTHMFFFGIEGFSLLPRQPRWVPRFWPNHKRICPWDKKKTPTGDHRFCFIFPVTKPGFFRIFPKYGYFPGKIPKGLFFIFSLPSIFDRQAGFPPRLLVGPWAPLESLATHPADRSTRSSKWKEVFWFLGCFPKKKTTRSRYSDVFC